MLFSRDVISDLLYLPLPPDNKVFVVEQQHVKISNLVEPCIKSRTLVEEFV